MNTFFKIAPLLLLGFSENVLFSVAIMHMVVAYLSHANIKTYTGILDYIIVTPKLHHFHHSTNMAQAKNFGNILPFWDQVCGTFYNKNELVEEVGVVKSDTVQYPGKADYLEHLKFPFSFKNCC